MVRSPAAMPRSRGYPALRALAVSDAARPGDHAHRPLSRDESRARRSSFFRLVEWRSAHRAVRKKRARSVFGSSGMRGEKVHRTFAQDKAFAGKCELCKLCEKRPNYDALSRYAEC